MYLSIYLSLSLSLSLSSYLSIYLSIYISLSLSLSLALSLSLEVLFRADLLVFGEKSNRRHQLAAGSYLFGLLEQLLNLLDVF